MDSVLFLLVEFSGAVCLAIKKKLQKLHPENEQQEILRSVMIVQELRKEMPLRFKQIIANRELERDFEFSLPHVYRFCRFLL